LAHARTSHADCALSPTLSHTTPSKSSAYTSVMAAPCGEDAAAACMPTRADAARRSDGGATAVGAQARRSGAARHGAARSVQLLGVARSACSGITTDDGREGCVGAAGQRTATDRQTVYPRHEPRQMS
jgi:hypothetical protein